MNFIFRVQIVHCPSCDAVVSCIDGGVNQHEQFTVMYISFIYTETFTRIGL